MTYAKFIRLVASAALLLILGLWAMPVQADSMMDGYNTGFDGNATAYGVYQKAQTFTTTNSYYVSSLVLNIYRMNSPGNITVSLLNAVGGLPYGSAIVYGTYDTSALGNNTPGNVSISLSPVVLSAYGEYAIVLDCPTGNATDYVGWMMDSSSPTYTAGSRIDSVNDGLTWTIDNTDDFMFEVWGAVWMPSSNQIEDAIVVPNVYENGDWYIAVHYNNTEAGYPDGDVSSLYSFVLFDGTLDVAKFPCPAWGYMPASLYISYLTRVGGNLTWEEADIGVELRDELTDTAVYSYLFQPQDWETNWQMGLDEWIRATAQQMETYYGVDMYTEEISETSGNKTLPSGAG